MSSDEAVSIRLDHFLKIAGAVETGGEAKLSIQGGQVEVNGQEETRRRRKLQPGDVVEIHGESFTVELDESGE